MYKKIMIIFLMFLLVVFFAGCKETKEENEASDKGIIDYGKQPFVLDIEEATVGNNNFRVAKWTGNALQMTLMSLKAGEEIGFEKHDGMDQFIRIEKGKARVVMGKKRDDLSFDQEVSDDWAILIPGGYWHNVINIGKTELKLYSIYSPPEHKAGTVHVTSDDSAADDSH